MIEQPTLFEERVTPNVGTLNAIVLKVMSDGKWRMPWELCEIILRDHKLKISDSSSTARLRDLRKPKFGGRTVSKRKRTGSTAFEYRVE